MTKNKLNNTDLLHDAKKDIDTDQSVKIDSVKTLNGTCIDSNAISHANHMNINSFKKHSQGSDQLHHSSNDELHKENDAKIEFIHLKETGISHSSISDSNFLKIPLHTKSISKHMDSTVIPPERCNTINSKFNNLKNNDDVQNSYTNKNNITSEMKSRSILNSNTNANDYLINSSNENTDIVDEQKAEKNLNLGHRERLRQKVLQNHITSLHNYEIFEMLMHIAQPRKDCKNIAKILISEFSSIHGILSADIGRLRSIKGVGDSTIATIKLVYELYCRLAREQISGATLLNTNHKVVEYCKITMAHLQHEEFRILFLNKKNILITDEVQQRGTIDQTPIFPREVVKRAIEIGAAAIIMVHNHPSGDPTPSQADIDITVQVYNALKTIDIKLHDHIVIGKLGHVSMRAENMF